MNEWRKDTHSVRNTKNIFLKKISEKYKKRNSDRN